LRAVADELPKERTPGRNEKKYQKLLDDYLGPVTGILILILCLFVYRFDMESSEKIADHLAMNPAEQDLIIPPLASLMDKQGWDEETRDRILQSGDYIGLSIGMAMYCTRVAGTLRELKGSVNSYEPGRHASQQAPANGHDGGIAWGSAIAGLSQYAAN
jgi:hypothetical protein